MMCCRYETDISVKHISLSEADGHHDVLMLLVLGCVFQGGNVALMASDSQSVLGRAFLKYADALTLDDVNSTYHFHVGRLLVTQRDYSSAVARLETALSWNIQHQLARFVTH